MFCYKIFCLWTLFSIYIAWDVLGKFHYIYTVKGRNARDLNNMFPSRLRRFLKQVRKEASFDCYFSGILGLFF